MTLFGRLNPSWRAEGSTTESTYSTLDLKCWFRVTSRLHSRGVLPACGSYWCWLRLLPLEKYQFWLRSSQLGDQKYRSQMDGGRLGAVGSRSAPKHQQSRSYERGQHVDLHQMDMGTSLQGTFFVLVCRFYLLLQSRYGRLFCVVRQL